MNQSERVTFDKAFIIYVPGGESALEWARRNWDTYGFDYDREKTGLGSVLAWSLFGDEALAERLEEDGIEFETLDVDWVAHFGV